MGDNDTPDTVLPCVYGMYVVSDFVPKMHPVQMDCFSLEKNTFMLLCCCLLAISCKCAVHICPLQRHACIALNFGDCTSTACPGSSL